MVHTPVHMTLYTCTIGQVSNSRWDACTDVHMYAKARVVKSSH